MLEERADAFSHFRIQDVLHATGGRVEVRVLEVDRRREQTLREPMSPHQVARPADAALGEREAVAGPENEPAIDDFVRGALVVRNLLGADRREHERSAFLPQIPHLLEKMVAPFVPLAGRRPDRAQAPVMELDAPVGQRADLRVMGHEDDRVPGPVQAGEDLENDARVILVEISRGLVGQDESRLIDERARDADPLLLAAGHLARPRVELGFETDLDERCARLRLVGHGMVMLRDHDVLERGQVRQHVELLEHEPDPLAAVARPCGIVERAHLLASHGDRALVRSIEPAEEIEERRRARTGRAHDGQPLAGLDLEIHALERLLRAVDPAYAREGHRKPGARSAHHHSPRRTRAGSIVSA